MYAVGRLGSYFARGVYTVSGPFHPFGGAVDIIVVEHPDGSFKSSPWYVRFGKFQGVLKTREKVVSIDVNGVHANFQMYLDHKGEAYFLKEVDIEEGESVFCPSSSGDETDGQCSNDRRPTKSKSCTYGADKLNSADRIGGSEIKVLSRSNSHRAKTLGLVFGRRFIKEDGYKEGEDGVAMVRLSSLERADYAADLLEVKWSTNLASSRAREDNDSRITSPDASGEGVARDKQVDDEHRPVESLVRDDEKDSSYNSVLNEEANIDISSFLGSNKQVIDTSPLGESILEERFEMVSEISRTDQFGVVNVYHDACEEHTQPDSVLQCDLEASGSKRFDEELACKKKDAAVPGCVISERGADGVQSFVYHDTSESSVVGTDGSKEQTHKIFFRANGGCGEVHVHLETLHVTTELLPEDANGEVGKDPADASKNCSDQMNAAPCDLDYNASDLEKPLRVQELSTQIVTVEPALCLSKEVESQNIYTTSSVNLEVQDGDDLHQSLASGGDSQKYFGVLEAGSDAPSESSEEELLFGDLDEFKICKDASSPDYEKNVNHPLSDVGGIKEVNGSVNANDEESSSSSNMLVQNNESADPENLREESSVMSSPVAIPKNPDGDKKVGRLAESLPILWSPALNLTADDTQHPLSHSLDTKSESLKWTLLSESDPSSNINEDQQFAQEQPNTPDTLISEEIKAVLSSPVSGNPSQTIVSSGGSWRFWPFFLSRSSSVKAMQPGLSENEFSDAENLRESVNCMDGAKSVSESKIVKKILRSITPTSEQLASLNLKEGGNTVTFTFSTPMLGKQQVDARIYLWKWNTRIVISDVDGTITKSDVLGQFMPLVGMDWSQTGVVHLFSAIKENGYQFLFLSARSISQAYITRRFLFNLKQDGKALPEGPVLISPDGLFPSLFREVIRRAPHEFKIACLENIRALFPADCNPFYAGFGNRDTDEISYLKVGIPRGKIFTINPKGEIAVNRRVDTKSYGSLHALVHGMFPPTTSSEQEDFNTWNFWKLPPPEIDI